MFIYMLNQYRKKHTTKQTFRVLVISTLRPTFSHTKTNWTREFFALNIDTTISNAASTLTICQANKNPWTIQSYRFISDFKPDEHNPLSRIFEPKFRLTKERFIGHSLTLVQKRKIGLKWDDLNTQYTRCATTKWLLNEIFATMAGAASKTRLRHLQKKPMRFQKRL